MVSANIRVQSVERKIEVTVEPEEAKRAVDYLERTRATDHDVPYSVNLIFGALSAVANNREYGGH